jgi:hypothetical protein
MKPNAMKTISQLLSASQGDKAKTTGQIALFFALIVKVILPIVNGIQAVIALLQIAKLF